MARGGRVCSTGSGSGSGSSSNSGAGVVGRPTAGLGGEFETFAKGRMRLMPWDGGLGRVEDGRLERVVREGEKRGWAAREDGVDGLPWRAGPLLCFAKGLVQSAQHKNQGARTDLSGCAAPERYSEHR